MSEQVEDLIGRARIVAGGLMHYDDRLIMDLANALESALERATERDALVEQVRAWRDENRGHEVYEATEDQPAECTDECDWCPLDAILAISPPDALDAVKAAAWDEGYSHCFDCPEPGTSLNDNPYRKKGRNE